MGELGGGFKFNFETYFNKFDQIFRENINWLSYQFC